MRKIHEPFSRMTETGDGYHSNEVRVKKLDRKSTAEKIIPPKLLGLLDNYYQNTNNISSYEVKYPIRMVPFKTVAGSGVFPAFKPKNIINPEGILKKAYIAICPDRTLSEEIGALINPELIS